jgi:uncharacterized peroxidase-related enzyme
MPLLDPMPEAQVAESLQPAFDRLRRKMQLVPKLWQTMAYAPAATQAALDLGAAIGRELDPKLRELAYVHCSRLNHCTYCLHYHLPAAERVGLTAEQTQAENLARFIEHSAYNEVEKLVLRFADEWTRLPKVSAEVIDGLKKHLSPAALVTLAATCALANWTNKFCESFAVELP